MNSRSVAKLMHIKQKIRGTQKANPRRESILIDNKPLKAAYDALDDQRVQSQNKLAGDLARQREALQQRLARRGNSRGTAGNISGVSLKQSVSHANFGASMKSEEEESVQELKTLNQSS